MDKVSIRLFGMQNGHARLNKFDLNIKTGMTIQELWDQVQSSAKPGERLATVDQDALLALINGRPIHYTDGWDTQLNADDQVTFMLKTAGG